MEEQEPTIVYLAYRQKNPKVIQMTVKQISTALIVEKSFEQSYGEVVGASD